MSGRFQYIILFFHFWELDLPFDRRLDSGKGLSPFLSFLPLGVRVDYSLGGGAFLLCFIKRSEGFYNPKLFFYICTLLLGQPLPSKQF